MASSAVVEALFGGLEPYSATSTTGNSNGTPSEGATAKGGSARSAHMDTVSEDIYEAAAILTRARRNMVTRDIQEAAAILVRVRSKGLCSSTEESDRDGLRGGYGKATSTRRGAAQRSKPY